MTSLNHSKLYKKLYKKIIDSLKALEVGIYFKKKQMWGNGL